MISTVFRNVSNEWSARNLQNAVPVRLYLGFRSMISLNLHISHFPRLIICCGSVSFLLSVYNEGYFTWSTKCLFSCILASIWATLLKINTASSPRIRYKRCTFGWNRLVMKVNLLERTRYLYVHISGFLGEISSNFIPCTFHVCATHGVHLAAIGQWWRDFTERTKLVFFCTWASVRVIFPKPHTLYFPRMRYKRCKVGCDRAIMKDNLLAEEGTFLVSVMTSVREMQLKFTHRTFRPCATEGVSFLALWR
jgi:hypothetical protein